MVMVVGISLALAKQRAQIESHLQSRSLLHRTICSKNRKPDDRKMTAMRSDGESFLSDLALPDRHRRCFARKLRRTRVRPPHHLTAVIDRSSGQYLASRPNRLPSRRRLEKTAGDADSLRLSVQSSIGISRRPRYSVCSACRDHAIGRSRCCVSGWLGALHRNDQGDLRCR
jgi:hypothetical protein